MAEQNAKAATAPKTGTETVSVALKHPIGIVIESYVESAEYEDLPGGRSREMKVFRPTGQQFTLNGNRVPHGKQPNFIIANGFAITPGVPKDLWENWLKHHKDDPLVANGLIDAHPSMDYLKGYAKEGQSLKHGMEPMAKKDDPRSEKKKNRQGKFVDAVSVYDQDDDGRAAA